MANSRTDVDAQLDLPVEDPVWDYLDAQGYVEEFEFGLISIADIAAMVRRIRAATVGRVEPWTVREPGLPKAGDAARARIDALSAIYAAWASARLDVVRFRDTALARAFRLMSAEVAASIGFDGTIEQDRVGAWVRWCYNAESPGADGASYVKRLIAETQPRGARRVADLRYIDGTVEQWLTVPAAGVLGQLAQLADKLSTDYRWLPSEATTFVLTGRTPEVFVYMGSAEVRYHELGATTRVTMTLDPALNPDEVAGIYSRLRQRFHPAPLPRYQPTRRYRLAGHVGPHLEMRVDEPGSREGPGRPPAPGPTGLATFITPIRPHTWHTLRASWNEVHGSETDKGTQRTWFYDNSPNFIRDAKAAVSQLIFPGWRVRN